jgi:hypothetical protein
MPATKQDILFEQGSKFEFTIQAKNNDGTIKDLSGYQARMQVRPTVGSSTILASATSGGGEITINGPLGIVEVVIGADVVTTYTWDVGVYDLEVYTTTANVIRLTEGFAALHKEVTR